MINIGQQRIYIETVWSARQILYEHKPKQILMTGEILEMVKKRRKLKVRIITEYKINKQRTY